MNTTTSITPSRQLVNEEVNVTSMYFKSAQTEDRPIKGYPKRMEYEGREYTFMESGLRYLLHKGQQLFEVFDMTDGNRLFRLKFDPEQHIWTLVGVRESKYAPAA